MNWLPIEEYQWTHGDVVDLAVVANSDYGPVQYRIADCMKDPFNNNIWIKQSTAEEVVETITHFMIKPCMPNITWL